MTIPKPADALAERFRTAMRGVASTIHVVTVMVDGVAKGMTATAVSSLSLAPPSLLVCMNEAVSMHGAMSGASLFRVNVLRRRHGEVARAFSNSALREVRFATGEWLLDGEAAPRLADAQASLLCRAAGRHRFGTHTIFLGEVIDVTAAREPDRPDPLIWFDGDFAGGPVAARTDH